MPLKTDRVEIYQLYGDATFAELKAPLETFLNDGWTLHTAQSLGVDPQSGKAKTFYVFLRTVKVPEFTKVPGKTEVLEDDNVVTAVEKGKIGKKVEA